MYYTVYKTTNKINNKIYVGVHRTSDLNDNYLGSGKILGHAIVKYGVENFEKEILHQFDTCEKMYRRETEIVTNEFISREDTYNIKLGGEGGFDYINSVDGLNNSNNNMSEEGKQNISEFRKQWNKENSEQYYQFGFKGREKVLEIYGKGNGTFRNKSHTEESKRKMSEARKGKGVGKQNSQYGTKWVHNLQLKQSKKVSKDHQLEDGWIKGRKIKF